MPKTFNFVSIPEEREFCKKANECDFLYQKRQFRNNMQRPFCNITEPSCPFTDFSLLPFPCESPLFLSFSVLSIPPHVPIFPIPSFIDASTNETSNNILINRTNKGSTQIRIPLGSSSKNSVSPTKSSPNYFVPSIVLSNVMFLAPKIDEINYYKTTRYSLLH